MPYNPVIIGEALWVYHAGAWWECILIDILPRGVYTVFIEALQVYRNVGADRLSKQ